MPKHLMIRNVEGLTQVRVRFPFGSPLLRVLVDLLPSVYVVTGKLNWGYHECVNDQRD